MNTEFYTLDVFTDQRFGGNPLAVVLDADELDGAMMQTVAREFNLSETVFVLKPEKAAHTARVRIFTPVRELPFAGHPTVGTAILLAQLRGVEGTVVLEEGVGPVSVKVGELETSVPFAELSSAVMPFEEQPVPETGNVAQALGISPADIGFDNHQPALFNAGNRFFYVPVRSRELLSRSQPKTGSWDLLEGQEGIGVFVYCKGDGDGIDFHARMFAPRSGIIEDPATGSAAASFPGAIHKAETLADGHHSWRVAQGEDMGRSSLIAVAADIAGGKINAVRVGGRAVRVSQGQIEI
ncbi:Phenazine biosynthesis protein PhzF like [hydrothermal vent metagenome]|uniref:Phenazine biosynthesis protein PhzF like n=1 Tax=hydrothermal vent metagenome TaxID=652676 RepID=A0A3B0SL81_9ZZZZ